MEHFTHLRKSIVLKTTLPLRNAWDELIFINNLVYLRITAIN